MKKVIVFSGKKCTGCKSLKTKLMKEKIDFDEVSMDTKEGAEFASRFGVRSIPTILNTRTMTTHIGDLPIVELRRCVA
jgi:glutaredoxin